MRAHIYFDTGEVVGFRNHQLCDGHGDKRARMGWGRWGRSGSTGGIGISVSEGRRFTAGRDGAHVGRTAGEE